MADSFLLLEDGSFLLLEDGTSKLILEDGVEPEVGSPFRQLNWPNPIPIRQPNALRTWFGASKLLVPGGEVPPVVPPPPPGDSRQLLMGQICV